MIQLLIIFFIMIFIIFIFYTLNTYEHFSDNYLYPIKGLSPICAKENLLPSYMPKACYVDGNLNNYANCKCEDKEGNCKICYDTIKKDANNATIVYNANDLGNS